MFKKIYFLSILFLPIFVFGASNLRELILSADDIVGTAIPVVASIAFLVFLWGVAKFVFNSGDSDNIESGKRLMIYGTIALFVMFSIWGIVFFLQDIFSLPRAN